MKRIPRVVVMNKVTVKILPPLPELFGIRSDILNGQHKLEIEVSEQTTLKHLISEMDKLCRGKFKETIVDRETENIRPYLLVVINGHVVNHSEMHEIKLNDGDIVTLLVPYSGG